MAKAKGLATDRQCLVNVADSPTSNRTYLRYSYTVWMCFDFDAVFEAAKRPNATWDKQQDTSCDTSNCMTRINQRSSLQA